jgi:hypothetical protein
MLFGLTYLWTVRDDLMQFVTGIGASASQASDSASVLGTASDGLLLLVLPAALGTLALLTRRPSGLIGVALLLWCAALTLPAYHFASVNIRSMDKHMAYALVFLAPLAGLGFASALRVVEQIIPTLAGRAAVGALVVAALVFGGMSELARAHQVQQNWPNKSETLAFLREQPGLQSTLILAEAGQIYEYHLQLGRMHAANNLKNTWDVRFRYRGARGEDAMVRAINEHMFSYLVFDGYHSPAETARLREVARRAGYRLIHTNTVQITDGVVTTEVYAAPRGTTDAVE